MDLAHEMVGKIKSMYVALRKKNVNLLDQLNILVDKNEVLNNNSELIELRNLHKINLECMAKERDELDECQDKELVSKTAICYKSTFEKYCEMIMKLLSFLTQVDKLDLVDKAEFQKVSDYHSKDVLDVVKEYQIIIGYLKSFTTIFQETNEAIAKLNSDMEETSMKFIDEFTITEEQFNKIKLANASAVDVSESKPISAELNKKLQMIKEVRLWTYNMLYGDKMEQYSDDDLRKYLRIIAYRGKRTVNSDNLAELFEAATEEAIGKDLSYEFPTEMLKTLPMAKCSGGFELLEFVGAGSSVQYSIPKNVLRKNLESNFVPLNLNDKNTIIAALDALVKEDMKYVDLLTTIEDAHGFMTVFEYLKLEME